MKKCIYNKIHFAVMAIEASAKKAGTTGKSMHDRLKAQGLIHKRLFRHYDRSILKVWNGSLTIPL